MGLCNFKKNLCIRIENEVNCVVFNQQNFFQYELYGGFDSDISTFQQVVCVFFLQNWWPVQYIRNFDCKEVGAYRFNQVIKKYAATTNLTVIYGKKICVKIVYCGAVIFFIFSSLICCIKNRELCAYFFPLQCIFINGR